MNVEKETPPTGIEGADFNSSERLDRIAGAPYAQRGKPLPPYGRAIVEMANAGLRPRLPSGTVVAACDWDIARHWPRIVLPGDPTAFDLSFAAGLDFLVLARLGHPQEHVQAVVRELLAAGANIAVPVVSSQFGNSNDGGGDDLEAAA
jgi:hypothetical protein